MSRVTLDPLPGKDRRGAWGRKDEEYMADFCLVSKRTLTDQSTDFSLSLSSRRGLAFVLSKIKARPG